MTLEKYQTRTEKPLLGLSLAFVVILITQLLIPDGFSQISEVLEFFNWIIWALFVLDYFLCVYLAEKKWLWVMKHPLELLIVVVPFLRPLRLLRALPMVIQLFKKGRSKLSGRTLSIALLGLVMFVVPATLMLYFVESPVTNSKITNLGDAAWWAVTTVTTVGYGDIYPLTTVGRILSAVVMLLGITFIGILTAAIASWFVQEGQEEAESEISQVLRRLNELEVEIKKLQK